MIKETASQRSASENIERSMVVTAGAGSGKTMVLVNRYIKLITTPCPDGSQRGIDEVVAITFTEKAAAEMREKVEKEIRLGRCEADEVKRKELLERLPQARISTIDSLCANLVRRFPILAGVIPDYGIISQGDSMLMMQRCVKKALEETSALLSDKEKCQLENCIASYKYGLQEFISELTSVTSISATRGAFDLVREVKVKEIGIDGILTAIRNDAYKIYKNKLYNMKMLDFAGIEAAALRLLRQNAGDVVRKGIKNLLVDEYQDTNEIQDEIIRLLVHRDGECCKKIMESGKLFIVGDNNQSIYSFRGANPRIFENWIEVAKDMEGHYVNLETNFRSEPSLINTYNGIFRELIGDKYRDVLPDPDKEAAEGDIRTTIIRAGYNGSKNSYIETANTILRFVNERTKLKDGRIAGFGDIALLVRANRDVRKYTEVFDRSKIPYVLVRSENLFASDCALFLADFIGFILNRNDSILAYSLLASAAVGVTEASIVYLKRKYGYLDLAISSDPSIDDEDAGYFKENEADRIRGLALMIDYAREMIQNKPSAEILDNLVNKLNLEDYILFGFGRQGLADFRKIKELASDSANELGSLSALREFIMANSEMKVEVSEPDILDDNENAVKVMTVHAAKGLEFPIVIFGKANVNLRRPESSRIKVDNEDWGLIYNSSDKNGNDEDKYSKMDREELIRVAYVALTRAKEYLVLSDRRRVIKCKEDGKWLYCLLEAMDEKKAGDTRLFRWLDVNEETELASFINDSEEARMPLEVTQDKLMLLHESDRLLRFSPSSLMCYKSCPKDFLSYYWYRLPREQAEAKDSIKSKGRAGYSGQDLGILVHSIVSMTEEPDNLEALTDSQSALLFTDLEDSRALKTKAVELSKRYLESMKQGHPCRISKEVPFSMNVGGYLLEGFIDRLEEHQDGSIKIIDIKTNKTSLDNIGLLTEKYKLQLNLYRFAASRILGNDRITSSIAFLDVEGFDCAPIENVVVREMETIPLELIERDLIETMDKASELPSKVERLDDSCHGCRYQEEGRCMHTMKDVEIEFADEKSMLEKLEDRLDREEEVE